MRWQLPIQLMSFVLALCVAIALAPGGRAAPVMASMTTHAAGNAHCPGSKSMTDLCACGQSCVSLAIAAEPATVNASPTVAAAAVWGALPLKEGRIEALEPGPPKLVDLA